MKIGELKKLLSLLQELPDDGDAELAVNYRDKITSLNLKWTGAGGPTEMIIKIPRTNIRPYKKRRGED